MSQWQVEIPRQVGLYVRGKREKLGLTRSQTAQRAGVSERLLASLELGDAPGIRLDKLLAILRALGLSLLVGDGDDASEGNDPTLATPGRAEPAERQVGADARASLHTAYDELYRAFVQSQDVRLQEIPAFEGRE